MPLIACLVTSLFCSVTGSLMKWNLAKINYFTVCFRQTLKNSANVNKKVSEMQCWLLCVFLFCYNSTGLKHRSQVWSGLWLLAMCSEAKLSDNRTYGYSIIYVIYISRYFHGKWIILPFLMTWPVTCVLGPPAIISSVHDQSSYSLGNGF